MVLLAPEEGTAAASLARQSSTSRVLLALEEGTAAAQSRASFGRCEVLLALEEDTAAACICEPAGKGMVLLAPEEDTAATPRQPFQRHALVLLAIEEDTAAANRAWWDGGRGLISPRGRHGGGSQQGLVGRRRWSYWPPRRTRRRLASVSPLAKVWSYWPSRKTRRRQTAGAPSARSGSYWPPRKTRRRLVLLPSRLAGETGKETGKPFRDCGVVLWGCLAGVCSFVPCLLSRIDFARIDFAMGFRWRASLLSAFFLPFFCLTLLAALPCFLKLLRFKRFCQRDYGGCRI